MNKKKDRTRDSKSFQVKPVTQVTGNTGNVTPVSENKIVRGIQEFGVNSTYLGLKSKIK